MVRCSLVASCIVTHPLLIVHEPDSIQHFFLATGGDAEPAARLCGHHYSHRSGHACDFAGRSRHEVSVTAAL